MPLPLSASRYGPDPAHLRHNAKQGRLTMPQLVNWEILASPYNWALIGLVALMWLFLFTMLAEPFQQLDTTIQNV
jgi:hypothetical protein